MQWFLELWDASHAVLGVISIIAVQRTIQKILIAVFLTREFKHDETNRAWWTGKWYGRGLGNSAISQPAREFLVKIVEMSLWGSDFLLGHFLLIILTPPILIPYINTVHSTMLCTFFNYFFLRYRADDLSSLAAPVQANSPTAVLDEAEAPAKMDCRQVHHRLYIHGRFTRIVDCVA